MIAYTGSSISRWRTWAVGRRVEHLAVLLMGADRAVAIARDVDEPLGVRAGFQALPGPKTAVLGR